MESGVYFQEVNVHEDERELKIELLKLSINNIVKRSLFENNFDTNRFIKELRRFIAFDFSVEPYGLDNNNLRIKFKHGEITTVIDWKIICKCYK